jgi:outer membrane lipoprotein-sorting protein
MRSLLPFTRPLLLLPLFLLTGCLYHTRKLQTPQAPTVVMNAEAVQLATRLKDAYDAIHSLSATVDLQASVGGALKGKVTDYTSFRGFILMRKPEMLRVLGLLPVVRTTAFDLVSDGTDFKLLIPSQNKAIEGNGSVTTKSDNPLMNLRPSLFFDAIMIRPIIPEDEVILTTDDNVAQDPKTKKWFEERDYLLSIVRAKDSSNPKDGIRELIPKRVIRFNRENLQPIEQDIYDQNGTIETQTLYGPLQKFGGAMFPGVVTIKRPLEEYQIVLTLQKLVLNQPLADDQFELKIPDGVQVKTLK